jgi:hypothetical protein
MLTFRNRLSVRRIDRQLEIMTAGDTSGGNEARRHGDYVALASELTTPPVRTEQLDELGLAVNDLSLDSRAAQDVFV